MELQIRGVAKTYPNGVQALKDVTLTIPAGMYGLLGPNGAGKSTLMRILATLAKPTGGQVHWNGEDTARKPDPLRRTLGYLPQDFGVYPMLSAREFLAYLSAVKGVSAKGAAARVDTCLAQVGLADVADRRLGEFSGGMRQRVGIAQALLNDPKLLIVDEPTVGLDPEERLRFRHLISDLAADRLVILSTHIVSDIEASASSLAVMAKGRLLFSGTPEALIADAAGHVWEWTVPEPQVAAIRARHVTTGVQRRADGVRLRLVAETTPSPDAVPVAAGLEDAHLWLVARSENR